jgi:hypothetical protein
VKWEFYTHGSNYSAVPAKIAFDLFDMPCWPGGGKASIGSRTGPSLVRVFVRKELHSRADTSTKTSRRPHASRMPELAEYHISTYMDGSPLVSGMLSRFYVFQTHSGTNVKLEIYTVQYRLKIPPSLCRPF